LLRIQEKTDSPTEFGAFWAFSYPNFLDLRTNSRQLDLAAWRPLGGTLSSPGQPDYIRSTEASASLLSVLGVTPQMGRDFLPSDDTPGAAPVALVSDGIWHGRFNAQPSIVGATINFNGQLHTVVGVLPPSFRIGDDPIDLITPIGQDTARYMTVRGAHPGIRVWARLRPDADPDNAQAEVSVVASQLAKQFPDTNQGRTFVAKQLRPDIGDARSTIWLLFGAAVLVLLIGCVNVASLLVARGVSREKEFAVRAALGASRSRLIRQCLTESAFLGLCGGALGVLLARVGLAPFIALWPGTLPRAWEVYLDWHVAAFAVAASLASGFFFGLAPALRAPLTNLEGALRTGARSLVGGSRQLHGILVASEIALAMTLLVSAGILGRTLFRLSLVDPGVNTHNLLVTRMAISPSVLSDPAKIRARWQEVLDRTRKVPGVKSVALVDTVPLREGVNELSYWPTSALPPRDQLPLTLATSVTLDYLDVTGIRLLAGRFFNAQDRLGSQLVVVIDEVLAQRAFGKEPALGKQLWIPNMAPGPVLVVGVVAHVRHWGVAADDQSQVRAQVYYPLSQVPDTLMRRWSELMSVAVRTAGDPLSIVEPLRQAIRGVANDQVLSEIRTMDQLAASTLARHNFLMLLFSAFSGLALLLASLGIYGVIAYLTRLRTPEFGVRIALGATATDIVSLVLKQSVRMIAAGIATGLIGAYIAGRLIELSLAGVESTQPLTFTVMMGVLAAAALAACLIPARRAARIDPTRALRTD
jgi:putative ABC transport system permease protein